MKRTFSKQGALPSSANGSNQGALLPGDFAEGEWQVVSEAASQNPSDERLALVAY